MTGTRRIFLRFDTGCVKAVLLRQYCIFYFDAFVQCSMFLIYTSGVYDEGWAQKLVFLTFISTGFFFFFHVVLRFLTYMVMGMTAMKNLSDLGFIPCRVLYIQNINN